MSNSRKNADVLKKIIMYCDQIDEASVQFGNSLEKLQNNSIYRNATAMCIIQIGELTTHLSEEFKAIFDEMPWQDIKRMRNIVAHRYGEFSSEILWNTITKNIPALREYCENIIQQYEVIAQDCNEEIDYEPEEEQGRGMKME